MINNQLENLAELHRKAKEIKEANPQAKFLVNTDIAELVTGLKKTTLHKKRWEGADPRFYKVHGKIFYDFFDLLDFVDGCLATSTTKEVA